MQAIADRVGVVGLITEQATRVDLGDEGRSALAIVAMPSGQLERNRQAEGVDDEVNLGRAPTPRAADRVRFSPPLPPAECWCARFAVLSRLCHSSSMSVRSAAKSRSHLPFLDQRSNRLKTVFHGPNSSGRSRHGVPVRRHHSTASMKLRSSLGGRPARLSPSRNAATLCHCSSASCCRSIVATPWSTRRSPWKTSRRRFRDRP